MPDDQAGRDALATETGFRRAIEHELDADRGGDRRPQSTDQRGRGQAIGPPARRAAGSSRR